jgi:hypothetical protein
MKPPTSRGLASMIAAMLEVDEIEETGSLA